MKITPSQIRQRLKQVTDPELGLNIVDLGFVKKITIKDTAITVNLTLTSPLCPFASTLANDVKKILKLLKGVQKVTVRLS